MTKRIEDGEGQQEETKGADDASPVGRYVAGDARPHAPPVCRMLRSRMGQQTPRVDGKVTRAPRPLWHAIVEPDETARDATATEAAEQHQRWVK